MRRKYAPYKRENWVWGARSQTGPWFIRWQTGKPAAGFGLPDPDTGSISHHLPLFYIYLPVECVWYAERGWQHLPDQKQGLVEVYAGKLVKTGKYPAREWQVHDQKNEQHRPGAAGTGKSPCQQPRPGLRQLFHFFAIHLALESIFDECARQIEGILSLFWPGSRQTR